MTSRINRKNLITILSAAILVGTEILGAALAFGWAMGGLFELGKTATNILIGVSLLLGAYATWRFVEGAAKIEPIIEPLS